MKGIDLLPISAESANRLREIALQYKRFAKIYIEIISFSDNRVIVRVEQKEFVNKKHLTKPELVERVREMFSGETPSEWKLTVSAVDFDRSDIESIDSAWISRRMEKLNLKAKHLSTHTGIDKSTISVILSDSKELTKWHKVALYYFFKYYELSNFNKK